jgi:hypothetical protein
LYVDPAAPDLCASEGIPERPLADLGPDELRASREAWSSLMRELG